MELLRTIKVFEYTAVKYLFQTLSSIFTLPETECDSRLVPQVRTVQYTEFQLFRRSLYTAAPSAWLVSLSSK